MALFFSWLVFVLVCLGLVVSFYFVRLRDTRNNEKKLEEAVHREKIALQEKIKELESSCEIVNKSLVDAKTLLHEVHHRVKNNLQLINSMLNIQARRNNFTDITDFLKKAETRINSMALIHESLYQNDSTNDKIMIQLYVADLVKLLKQTFDISDDRVKIAIEAHGIMLSMKAAVSVGLILNELITNSLKYAFKDNREGTISINMERVEDNKFLLTVQDDGVWVKQSKNKSKSFGIELVFLLAYQLQGNVKFDTEGTTKYKVFFEEIMS